jgi:fumagillin biosynthesis dioxygenase
MSTPNGHPTTPPSIPPSALSDLKSNGYCIIPSVLPPDQVQATLSRLWQAAEESRKRGNPTHLPQLDPNESNVRVFYLMELDPLFRELIQHPIAVKMVREVLGHDFLISNFTANIARPGSQSMGLHSDQSLVVPEPWVQPWAVNIIWCLHDVDFENGATLFIPSSHKWTSLSDIPPSPEKLLKPFTAKAGDIVVMDGRVWHTSGANISKERDRALLFGYYTKPWLRQQVNWNRGLSDKTQEGLGEEMREWLGLGVTANTGRSGSLHYLREQVEVGRI